ncbi:hypothetical protein FTX61_21480 [Nitriliruptoraceae bacterium ZYF776]|nr:hypothetical protein [Profundirhabdus halotolerans]
MTVRRDGGSLTHVRPQQQVVVPVEPTGDATSRPHPSRRGPRQQDRARDGFGAPPQVPYTEFLVQVDARNVDEVFARGDSIQDVLRDAQPLPGRRAATRRS